MGGGWSASATEGGGGGGGGEWTTTTSAHQRVVDGALVAPPGRGKHNDDAVDGRHNAIESGQATVRKVADRGVRDARPRRALHAEPVGRRLGMGVHEPAVGRRGAAARGAAVVVPGRVGQQHAVDVEEDEAGADGRPC